MPKPFARHAFRPATFQAAIRMSPGAFGGIVTLSGRVVLSGCPFAARAGAVKAGEGAETGAATEVDAEAEAEAGEGFRVGADAGVKRAFLSVAESSAVSVSRARFLVKMSRKVAGAMTRSGA